ncbi:hypothetical protein CYMTET_38953 [Cymbomonas tetramitiformis]|uniref:Uncharacterized protein n=1 Tax=Cymbomonas tetramitiformis TaxID=36881 RepID=A0AAE0CCI1_9CHLO|nr:hypothetical protein CYMTET_38953 [Cymbomonas tetramitiformis]
MNYRSATIVDDICASQGSSGSVDIKSRVLSSSAAQPTLSPQGSPPSAPPTPAPTTPAPSLDEALNSSSPPPPPPASNSDTDGEVTELSSGVGNIWMNNISWLLILMARLWLLS